MAKVDDPDVVAAMLRHLGLDHDPKTVANECGPQLELECFRYAAEMGDDERTIVLVFPEIRRIPSTRQTMGYFLHCVISRILPKIHHLHSHESSREQPARAFPTLSLRRQRRHRQLQTAGADERHHHL